MKRAIPLRWRLRVCGLVFTVPPLLHLLPLHRVVGWLGSRRVSRASPPVDILVGEVDAWLTRLPRPWRSTCLKRAAILYALLRSTDKKVELHIGVKREADKSFAAHAWLVREGLPYLEPPTSSVATFQVITRFPEPVVTTP